MRQGIQVTVYVDVQLEEVAKLPPEVAAALMQGIAKVLSAHQRDAA